MSDYKLPEKLPLGCCHCGQSGRRRLQRGRPRPEQHRHDAPRCPPHGGQAGRHAPPDAAGRGVLPQPHRRGLLPPLQRGHRLMAELGLKVFRTSISWSRLYPTAMNGPQPGGVAFYAMCSRSAGSTALSRWSPCATLISPMGLVEQYGSWRSRKTLECFARYAETASKNTPALCTTGLPSTRSTSCCTVPSPGQASPSRRARTAVR